MLCGFHMHCYMDGEWSQITRGITNHLDSGSDCGFRTDNLWSKFKTPKKLSFWLTDPKFWALVPGHQELIWSGLRLTTIRVLLKISRCHHSFHNTSENKLILGEMDIHSKPNINPTNLIEELLLGQIASKRCLGKTLCKNLYSLFFLS